MALDYFTIADVRALRDIGAADDLDFTDAKVTKAGLWIQGIVERVCGTTFVAREVVETHDGNGTPSLLLRKPYVLDIIEVLVNGVDLDQDFTFDDGVLEWRTTGTYTAQPWARGRRNIVVTYQQGYSLTPPDDLLAAMLDAVRYRLLSQAAESGLTDRALTITNEFGNIQIAQPNATDRPTGLPEVDAVIADWAITVNTATYP